MLYYNKILVPGSFAEGIEILLINYRLIIKKLCKAGWKNFRDNNNKKYYKIHSETKTILFNIFEKFHFIHLLKWKICKLHAYPTIKNADNYILYKKKVIIKLVYIIIALVTLQIVLLVLLLNWIETKWSRKLIF